MGQPAEALEHCYNATFNCCLFLPSRCSEETLQGLERHLAQLSATHSLGSLANVLHFYATHRLQLGQAAAQAACDRALALLQQSQQQPAMQQGLSLGTLAKIMGALAALRLNHPPLLCALLPAAGAALAGQGQALKKGGSLPASLMRELVSLAAALGHLQAGGLLEPAGLGSPRTLLSFWSLLMNWVGCAADGAAQQRDQRDSRAGGGLEGADARCPHSAAGGGPAECWAGGQAAGHVLAAASGAAGSDARCQCPPAAPAGCNLKQPAAHSAAATG